MEGARPIEAPHATFPLAAVSTATADTTGIELPFDVYQRYRLVADLVQQVVGDAPASVLDVGGGTAVLRRFLPEQRVTLLDIEDRGEPDFVLGDGAALPFADGVFDLVVTCDTLEHVPGDARDAFLAECARVARRGVVIAGPYQSERVEEAEETLRAFLRIKLDIEHRYLEEHRTHGLPRIDAVEGALRAHGARVTSIGHGNLERWLALLCVSMYMDRDRHLRRIAEHAYRFYNRALYDSDRVEPVYRHAVVALFDETPLPDADDLFGPLRVPDAALEPFVHLAAELFAFDREADVYEAERTRLDGVIGGLLRDLEGHRARVVELEGDLGGHRGTLEALERDLEGHRTSLSTLRAERAAERELMQARDASHACEIEEHREVEDGLRAELDAQSAYAQKLEQELARVEALAEKLERTGSEERSAQRAARETLEADLEQHRLVVAELRVELDERSSYAAELEQKVHDLDALANEFHESVCAERVENEALRDELRSRWRNLERVLGFGRF